jgi:hypothetical protein
MRIDPKTAALEERWSYNTTADKEAFKVGLVGSFRGAY